MLIQKLRLQRGWSQEQLADLSGLSVRTIQRLERGQTASIESLKALGAAFGIDFSQLKEPDMTTTTETPASPAAPGVTVLSQGLMLKGAIASGQIKNVGEAYTDGWLPANAQRNMEQILTKNNNNVDAVVASNDGTAGGAIAALAAQGMAGTVAVSGQDGDHAALNRIALGTQTVSVWKDARSLGKNAAEVALQLADGKKMSEIPGVVKFAGGPKKIEMNALFLTPIPITGDNLNIVIDAGWITRAEVCQGVKPATVKVCG